MDLCSCRFTLTQLEHGTRGCPRACGAQGVLSTTPLRPRLLHCTRNLEIAPGCKTFCETLGKWATFTRNSHCSKQEAGLKLKFQFVHLFKNSISFGEKKICRIGNNPVSYKILSWLLHFTVFLTLSQPLALLHISVHYMFSFWLGYTELFWRLCFTVFWLPLGADVAWWDLMEAALFFSKARNNLSQLNVCVHISNGLKSYPWFHILRHVIEWPHYSHLGALFLTKAPNIE